MIVRYYFSERILKKIIKIPRMILLQKQVFQLLQVILLFMLPGLIFAEGPPRIKNNPTSYFGISIISQFYKKTLVKR
ncbi:hypothetical protein CUU66_05915 [Peribacillus deserti]|uniref:Uncharacterized protein n=1 Tax=Peribacillus deserti TaxID=673318 RepID=A0A2N5M8K3_9BACI|nr:hypothetical protein CUU66_05915 [Peribacillus deserti]